MSAALLSRRVFSALPRRSIGEVARSFSAAAASSILGGRLAGKSCIVTGAGSGIGAGIAQKFAAEGGKVAVCDLNEEAANSVAAKLSALGQTAVGVKMDVTSEKEVEDGVASVSSKFGGVDVIVINAGIQYIKPIHELSYDSWRKVVSVHLDAAFLCTRAALKEMYKGGRGGSVIYIGSVHSKTASPGKAPYVSGKHGIMGLSRTVAKEGAQYKVRSNVICPGYVLTPLVEKQIPDNAKLHNMSEEDVIKKVMLKDTVDGEFTTINDVAETATFLAAFETNALTGQSIIVSHGWFME